MFDNRRTDWFIRGCDAFKRSFPELARQIPWPNFYICPECLRAFNELCLTDQVPTNNRLTEEHVPPESAGGKRMLLTCGPCNWGGGTSLDSHMRREADVQDFLKGNLRQVNAQLGSGTASGRVPIKFSITDGAIAACGVPKASNPEFYQQLMRDFETATTDSLEEFEFRIELASYSQSRASASWLRSAYLAFFSVFGYRFICRQEMKAVREHIKKPEHSRLTFRLHRSEESAPLLLRIEEPRTFRSYAMFYGHNVVFLPRYGDLALYERLTEHSGMSGIIRAKAYPWPSDGPLHAHDHLVSA